MADTTQLSIRLPNKAIEMIEKDLIPTGLYGTSRAEVCKALILARLEHYRPTGLSSLLHCHKGTRHGIFSTLFAAANKMIRDGIPGGASIP